jgi:drug/metabolite transporter (DMT)-like permease
MRRTPDPELGALAFAFGAFVLCLGGAALDDGIRLSRELLPFAAAGAFAPGISGICFTRAIQAAGAARTSVVVGGAPLVSVVIAIALLDEPAKLPLILGAVLIVTGGVVLIGERIRPHDFRLVGLWLGFGATVLFATRDNLVRWLSGETEVPPLSAGATAAGTASVLLLGWIVLTRRGLRIGDVRPFGLTALLAGASYVALFEAYYRGRVTVVSPLISTEALFGVLAAALVFGRAELIGRRLVAGATLVAIGGGLIGAFR